MERPTVRTDDGDFEVSEVSEEGARLILVAGSDVRQKQPIIGTLRFRDGEIVEIEGTVLRCDEHEIVVGLSRGVSLQHMLAEQRRLRQKYPLLFDEMEDDSDPGQTEL